MTPVFADSFYFIALVNPRDAAHRKAVEFSDGYDGPLVTTAWVLTELADGLARSSARAAYRQILDGLEQNSDHSVVGPNLELFERGSDLYDARPDKQW